MSIFIRLFSGLLPLVVLAALPQLASGQCKPDCPENEWGPIQAYPYTISACGADCEITLYVQFRQNCVLGSCDMYVASFQLTDYAHCTGGCSEAELLEAGLDALMRANPSPIPCAPQSLGSRPLFRIVVGGCFSPEYPPDPQQVPPRYYPCEPITCCVATYHLIFRLDPISGDPIREYEYIDGPNAENLCYLLGPTCVEICGSWPGAPENGPLNDPQDDVSLAGASISQVPAMDAIEVTTPSGDRSGATLRILNAEGRSLISVDQTESNGRFTFVVPVRELAAGYYRCEVIAGEELIASVNYTKSR